MSLEKKVIDPPSIGDYLHGYTLSYQSYGSLWQLLGTGAWFWTRENNLKEKVDGQLLRSIAIFVKKINNLRTRKTSMNIFGK
uniref:Uncharacterized protein n=1 Tax=Magallana gigas TaxID=29159 RepID=K1RE73_MAGGI